MAMVLQVEDQICEQFDLAAQSFVVDDVYDADWSQVMVAQEPPADRASTQATTAQNISAITAAQATAAQDTSVSPPVCAQGPAAPQGIATHAPAAQNMSASLAAQADRQSNQPEPPPLPPPAEEPPHRDRPEYRRPAAAAAHAETAQMTGAQAAAWRKYQAHLQAAIAQDIAAETAQTAVAQMAASDVKSIAAENQIQPSRRRKSLLLLSKVFGY